MQSSARSARKAALRREVADQPRFRLTPRPRSMQPPAGAAPRYGEIPEPAREALNRSSAEFTAGRLEERAQHARQAAARAARAAAGGTDPGPAGEQTSAGAATGEAAAGGPAADSQMAATDGQMAVTGHPAAGQPGPGNGFSVGEPATAAGRPAAQWAWPSIAAMIVPLLVLILVVLA